MATSEENDLIGYDPLAWMAVGTDKNEKIIDNDYCGDDSSLEEPPFIADEMSMTDDHSDSLLENAEKNVLLASEENKFIIDETEDESGTAIMDEAVAERSEAVTGSVVQEEPDSQIDLDATLTIQNIAKLYEHLKNVLAVHDEIEINASDVSSIDTSTLQLLVSLKKDADKLQKKVSIIYPSPRFVESAQLLGLLDVLNVHEM